MKSATARTVSVFSGGAPHDAAVYDRARKAFMDELDSGDVDPLKLRRLRAVQPFASPLMRGLLALSGSLRGKARS